MNWVVNDSGNGFSHFPRQMAAISIFKSIFLNQNVWILIKISLKFVHKGPIDYILVLVQIMAWRRSDDKPLSEIMLGILPTHICVVRPQWVKNLSSAKMNSKYGLLNLGHFSQAFMSSLNFIILSVWNCQPDFIITEQLTPYGDHNPIWQYK